MTGTIIAGLNYLFAITLPFSHIGGYVAGGLGFFLAWRAWRVLRHEPVFFALLAFLAYGAARAFFSAEPGTGMDTMTGYLTHWLLPFLLGYALAGRHAFAGVTAAFFITFTVLIAVSVLAYFGVIPGRLGDGLFLSDEGLLKGLRSHIALAAMCLLLAFLSAGQAWKNSVLTRRGKTAAGLLAAFFLAALLLTGSRGYFLAAVFTGSLFLIVRVVRTGNWKTAFAFAAAALVLFAALWAVSPALRGRVHRTNAADPNVQGRLGLYQVALAEIRERPLFGFGPGQGIRQTRFFEMLPPDQRYLSGHPHLHSFYLNLAADLGLAGVALFAVLLGLWLRAVARASAGASFLAATAVGLFWGLIGILAGENFDALLRGPGVAMELFWLTGLVLRQLRERERTTASGRPFFRGR